MPNRDKAPERIWVSLWEDEALRPLDQKLNNEDVEYIRADLVEEINAERIPGRCGECGHFEGRGEVPHGVCGYLKCKTEGCTKLYVQWMKNKKDFCNEWKPKE